MESSFGTFNSNITLHSKNKAEKAHVLPGQNFNFTLLLCSRKHLGVISDTSPNCTLIYLAQVSLALIQNLHHIRDRLL